MRKKFVVFIAAILLLSALTGCGKEADTAEENKKITVTRSDNCISSDISEPNAVDDSYSFDVPEALDTPLVKYFKDSVLPGYAESMTESGKIIDSQLVANYAGSDVLIYGWVLLDNSAKADNNWRSFEMNGEQYYCRSIFAVGKGEGCRWRAEKSSYMKPAERIKRTYGFTEVPLELGELKGAELYVNQLGQSYFTDDKDTLQRLREALSRPKETFNLPSPPLSSAEFLNPLYLYFNDGSVRLVETMGSGAPGNDCFDAGSVWGPASIFEIMGVPLNAKGYLKAPDGSVKVSVDMLDVMARDTGTVEYNYTATVLYDAEGKLISIDSPDEQREMRFQKFEYDSAGRLKNINTQINGQLVNIEEFQYDTQGLLLRRTSHSPDMLSGYYREYEYDNENRITADIFHKLDGSEGGTESNVYYWYDESSVQHIYSFNSDGSINGDAPADLPIRKH